jgi:hypothetical protein
MLGVCEAVKNIKRKWDVTPYGSGVHKAINEAVEACDNAECPYCGRAIESKKESQ